MPELVVENLCKRFGEAAVLREVSFTVKDGEFFTLLGPSGCGKSTTLNCVAGLERPDEGRIRLEDRVFVDTAAKVFLPPEARNLGMVFQSYALWPHMTVHENVAYALVLRKIPRAQANRRVRDVLVAVGLGELGDRYPSQLSGGQQQRVALARALVYEPPLLLLDEPLSNLDAKLREEARVWIRTLIKNAGLAAIFVTHDQVEAMAIADRIMLLQDGAMVQNGTPQQLYTEPESLFAADFMGINSSFEAPVTASLNGHARLDVGRFSLWGRNKAGRATGDTGTAVIRTEHVRIAAGADAENHLLGQLAASAYLGGHWEHVFDVEGHKLRALSHGPLANGVYALSLPKDSLWIF